MAFIASAIIGGVAVVGGALIASSGAKSAANAQAGAANNATQAQLDMFNQSREMSAPTRNLGYGADVKLAQLFGINPATLTNTSYGMDPNSSNSGGWPGGSPSFNGSDSQPGKGIGSQPGGGNSGWTMMPDGRMVRKVGITPGPNQTPMTVDKNGNPIKSPTGAAAGAAGAASGSPDYSGFYNSPGFQFAKDLGNQSIQRQQAAGGGLYSANTMTLESQYNTGFASQHYNDYVQQLLNMAGMGNGSSIAGGNQAVETGKGISNNIISGGNAQASGDVASAGAIAGGLGGLADIYKQYQNRQTPYTMPSDLQNASYNTPPPDLIKPW